MFSRAHLPVRAGVNPGDTVIVRPPDASGHLERQAVPGEDRSKLIADARGHCLARPRCVAADGPPSWLLWELDAGTGTTDTGFARSCPSSV